jgi:hypothetical protein
MQGLNLLPYKHRVYLIRRATMLACGRLGKGPLSAPRHAGLKEKVSTCNGLQNLLSADRHSKYNGKPATDNMCWPNAPTHPRHNRCCWRRPQKGGEISQGTRNWHSLSWQRCQTLKYQWHKLLMGQIACSCVLDVWTAPQTDQTIVWLM